MLALALAGLVVLAGCIGESPSPSDASEAGQHAPRPEVCEPLTNVDAIGDVILLGTTPGVPDALHQHDAIDLVKVAILRKGEQVELHAEVVEPPPTGSSTDLAYRYWIGFNVNTPDGEQESTDIRVHDYPYEEGHLVSSNQLGNKRLGT